MVDPVDNEDDEDDFTPSAFTRDELLVFNTMAWLHDHIDEVDDIVGYLNTLENNAPAKRSFMKMMLKSADDGYQMVFMIPNKKH